MIGNIDTQYKYQYFHELPLPFSMHYIRIFI